MRIRIAVVIVLLLGSCGGTENPSEPTPSPSPSFRRAAVLIDTDAGSVIFEAEVAQSEAEKQQGLMGRSHLDDDHGMLFVFFEATTQAFWMKDTEIPLSIAFIGDDGRILEILDMPPCERDPCPSFAPSVPYDAALEVNQGAFDASGVEVGDRVQVSF